MHKSDDYSVASGDDSITWEKEEDQVLHVFAIQVEAEDALDDALEDDPVKEVDEWELIAKGGGEGTADEVAAPPQSSLRQEPSTKDNQCEVTQGDFLSA